MVFRRHGTANILAVFASGSEVTSLGQIQHTGDHTRNGLQAFLLLSHSGDGIKKSLSIRMAGTVDHVIPGAAFHDFAAVHHDDTIRHLGNHRQVMGDQDERRAHWHPNVLYLLDQFQAVRFSELETISLQAEMKAALRQAIDQLYEEYVGIHLKAKKFIDSLSDWGAIMKDSSGGET